MLKTPTTPKKPYAGYPAERDLICAKCHKPIKKGELIRSYLSFSSLTLSNVHATCSR